MQNNSLLYPFYLKHTTMQPHQQNINKAKGKSVKEKETTNPLFTFYFILFT